MGNGSVSFHEKVAVTFFTTFFSILIQTDKRIYKPGQKGNDKFSLIT